mgnify:CR=1 FL=1
MQYKSSFFLFILKILGFFWCEWDSCIPTLIAKNTRFFLFYQDTFEGSYSYDTPSDWLLYRPLQPLLGHLTTFLESRCSVIFILNPITRKSKFFKKHIIIFQIINISIRKNPKPSIYFYFFLIFLFIFFFVWTFEPKIYDFTKGYEETTYNNIQ